MTNPTDPNQTNGYGYDPAQAPNQQPLGEAQPGGWSVPAGSPAPMPQQPAPYGQPYAQGYQQPGYAPGMPGQPVGFYAPAGVMPVAFAQKSKVVAALLAFFFGGFGIHDFYCGYNMRGALKLLGGFLASLLAIFTAFVSIFVIFPLIGLWAFLDFLFILLGTGWYATDARGIPLA